jgi:exosome complex RNA-binding protein Rrp42 (RNase PH superfamily)
MRTKFSSSKSSSSSRKRAGSSSVSNAADFSNAVIDTKVISRAAGSAYVELGDTKVMAAV